MYLSLFFVYTVSLQTYYLWVSFLFPEPLQSFPLHLSLLKSLISSRLLVTEIQSLSLIV